MEPKMIWANLASDDFRKTNDFYTKLGFKPNGANDSDEASSFLFGKNGFVINFFRKSRLQEHINGPMADTQTSNEIVFSLSATSKEDVDEWFEKVKDAKGQINTAPHKYQEGYTFCFSDPDGHKFNILYWPGM